jgi:hypothetical protein
MDENVSTTLPTLILNADGTTADANEPALGLFRATLEQLRELPPGEFSAEPPEAGANEAFREQWERQGAPTSAGRERYADSTAPRCG